MFLRKEKNNKGGESAKSIRTMLLLLSVTQPGRLRPLLALRPSLTRSVPLSLQVIASNIAGSAEVGLV